MQILENENLFSLEDAKVVQPLAKRKLVLVQINSPSLKKLRAILSEEYPIIDVDSEKEAVQLVDKQHDNISAILFNVELCKQSNFWLQKVLNEDKRFVDAAAVFAEDIDPGLDRYHVPGDKIFVGYFCPS